jgi:parallel beta-helix repeat protein
MQIVPRPVTGLIGGVGGINFVPLGVNDNISNSYIARTIDDAISFENNGPASVISQPSPTQLVVDRYVGGVHIPNGTPMDFVDRTTTLETTAGTIVTQNPPDEPNSFPSTLTLTFDRDLPTVAPNTILAFGSPATRGQGSIIEDNLIEDTYGGRGIWLSGVEGVTVQRNVIRRTSNAGILIENSTESTIDPGDAGPPSSGVLVTDNAMEATLGPAASGNGMQSTLGAIEVTALADPNFVFASSASISNVTIQNNYVADSGRSGLWVGELNSGTLQNNLLIRSNENPTLGGVYGISVPLWTEVQQDAVLPEVIGYASSVTETNDTVSATSNVTAPVTMNPPGTATGDGTAAGSFALQTAVNGFAWKAVSDSPWLTVNTGPLGAGNGTVRFSVAANSTGIARTGHITIAGETFTIQQNATGSVPCNVTGDQMTSIADLQAIVNEALGASSPANDLNGDGVVNVIDIQKVFGALLGFGCQ